MALPKQVEQQLREIEEIEKQMGGPSKPAEDTAAVDIQQTDPAPAEEPIASEPEVKAPEVKTTSDWEHKYRTLEGKYSAEVPRLHQQNKELATTLQSLQERVELLDAAAPSTSDDDRLVSDKDVEEYGQDLIDVQRRVAREVLSSELKARDVKIAQLEKALTKTGGDVATMSFEQRLAMEVPDFAAINADPAWIAWLDETDPYTGEPRRAFAEFAYTNGDISKIRKVVDFYKTNTNQTPEDAVRQQRQTELERQITPTRANTAPSTASSVKDRIYTEAVMTREFNKVKELNLVGKYEDAAKLENELSEAYMQGRVRG